MAESRFSKRMRDELRQFNFDFWRVESHATSPGIPDVHFLLLGTGGWIETKQVQTEPKKVNYRPQQAAWLQQYARRGGITCTLIHVVKTDVVLYVPGRESLTAEKSLQQCLGVRRIALREPEAWKRLAKLVLGGKVES